MHGMVKKKKEKLQFNKIEIDKNSEPKIVKASRKEVLACEKKQRSKKEKKKILSLAEKQLAMDKALMLDGVATNSDVNYSKRRKIFNSIMSFIFYIFIITVLIGTALSDFASEKELIDGWQTILIFRDNWYYFIFALVSLSLCYILKGLKLSIMCKARTKKFHFKTCFETGIIGHYYNSVTPLAVGGQPFEIYYLAKHGIGGGEASSLPIATFFLHQMSFVLLGLVALVSYKYDLLGTMRFLSLPSAIDVMIIIGLSSCLIMPLMVVIFCLLPRLGASIVKFVVFLGSKFKLIKYPEKNKYRFTKNVLLNAKSLKKLAANPVVFISSFLVSLAENLAMSSIAYFVLRFFGFDMINIGGFKEWMMIVQICILLYAGISFIPTPGNSGAADLSFYILFTTALGLTSNSSAFIAMLTWRVLSFYSLVIIGFVFANVKKRKDKKTIALHSNK